MSDFDWPTSCREPLTAALTRRCAHPTCRTSLDDYPTECPHRLPFCPSCVWEEGCDECNLAYLRELNARIWDEAAPTGGRTPGVEWADHWAEQSRDDREWSA